MGVFDLDGCVIAVCVNAVCDVLHLVTESDKVGLRFLPDIMIALEKRLILSALDSARSMLRVAASRLDQLGWYLLVERLQVDVSMLVFHEMLRTN